MRNGYEEGKFKEGIVMKINAPEKLYYAPYGDIRESHPITDNDIEYIRKDAFIDKAREWLRRNLSNYCDVTREDFELFIDDFRKYLKEE